MGVSTFVDKPVERNEVGKQQKQDQAPVCLQLVVGWYCSIRTMELTLTQFTEREKDERSGTLGLNVTLELPIQKPSNQSLCV